jgi:hypothetical protein
LVAFFLLNFYLIGLLPIKSNKAACLAPYLKDNINRFGAYFLDELREKLIIDFGLPVVSLSN